MKLINKIVIPFVAFAMTLLLVIVLFVQQSLRAALFRDEFFALQESVASEAATHLQPSDFNDPTAALAQSHFLEFTEGVSDSTTARVTVWGKNGTAAFSDLASIIGVRSQRRPGLESALVTGKAIYYVEAKDTEIPIQTDVGEYLDIYIPVTFAGQVVGVVEAHSVIGAVLMPIQRQVQMMSLLLVLGTVMLTIVFYLVAQFFVGRPLKSIDRFLGELERGNFDARLDIRSKDEIGALGKELNRMAGGLRRLQELKNEFVFIASHELRSPVAVIKGYLSLIQEKGPDAVPADVATYLENVRLADERLSQLVDEILDIARSEAGKLSVSVRPTGLAAAVGAIIQEEQVLAEAKQIVIAHDVPDTLPEVMADEGRVKEVMANLVTNAIKYSPEGTAIKIYYEKKGRIVTTHVRDAGFGIAKKEQEHVFEKFFRSEASREKGIVGTGLGLFITKQLVEKMGGKMWFQSKEGGGSTFSFSLKTATTKNDKT
jgi:signal transduction histidine kinase